MENYYIKLKNNESYFDFIKSYTLLKYYYENLNYDILSDIIENFLIKIVKPKEKLEKYVVTSVFLINLHKLYLYFSNYPYVYGALDDQDLNKIFSKFNSNLSEFDLLKKEILPYNLIIQYVNNLASKVDNGLSILNEKNDLRILQILLIEIHCANEILYNKKRNLSILSEYYQVKYYLRDIDFCLGIAIIDIILNSFKNYPLTKDIYYHYLRKDKRFNYYKCYLVQSERYNDKTNENEYAEQINKCIKYNDGIVLGNKEFHNLIKKISLTLQDIYYLNEEEFSNFFVIPKKIKNTKYKKCNYFIIMNEKDGIKYIETIRYISNVLGIKFATIIYIQDKIIKINKKILLNPFIHIILTYNEKDILNYITDTLVRLKELGISYFEVNEKLIKKFPELKYEFPKINEINIEKEYDNGWDMKNNVKADIFKLCAVNSIFGYVDISIITKEMFLLYKENNCLDLFLNYYAFYFQQNIYQNKILLYYV